jgi:holo-[acyl-carrier protein] synthase
MIVGTGVDVVDLARFERAVDRTPRLRARLFAESEQSVVPTPTTRSLAGRFAAKEAFIKALGGSDGVRWHDIRIVSDPDGNPSFDLDASLRRVVEQRGIDRFHLSISHDAGIAIAFVIAESDRR